MRSTGPRSISRTHPYHDAQTIFEKKKRNSIKTIQESKNEKATLYKNFKFIDTSTKNFKAKKTIDTLKFFQLSIFQFFPLKRESDHMRVQSNLENITVTRDVAISRCYRFAVLPNTKGWSCVGFCRSNEVKFRKLKILPYRWTISFRRGNRRRCPASAC